YGARGIYVCDEWRKSFLAFLADMGDPPDGKSLDRIDNRGPYAPSNCRWATYAEQSRNRSDSRIFEYDGTQLCLSDWAVRIGIGEAALRARLSRGWQRSEERRVG